MRTCKHTHILTEAGRASPSKTKGGNKGGKESKASVAAAAAAAVAAAGAGGSAVVSQMEALMLSPQQALLHLARGVQLSVRGEAWHEALNAVRDWLKCQVSWCVCVCGWVCGCVGVCGFVCVGCRQNTGTGAFGAWGAVGCGVKRRAMGP